jgi:putative ABC transport system permease protein
MTTHLGSRRTPRLAEWIASRAARRLRWRDTALGDLQEEFDEVAAAHGARRARAWYRRQALTLAAELAADRAHDLVEALRTFLRPSGDRPMRTLLQELLIAGRALRRQPLVTGIVLGTLALGLGANAATFGMIDRLMLRPFAIPGVERLVMAAEIEAADRFNEGRESVAPATFIEWRRQTSSLDDLAAFVWSEVNLSDGDRPEVVLSHRVTAAFFPLLGARAASGRLLTPEDELPGRPRVTVISDGLWRHRFDSTPDVIGRTVRLDGDVHEIVGVAAPGFDFPFATQLWTPLRFTAGDATDYRDRYLTVVGALPPGRTLEEAAAEARTVYARQQQQHPEDLKDRAFLLNTFIDGMADAGTPQILLVWQAAAILVLLIGCVNIVNLLLARGAERQRELAVRLAIGAGRARIVRQLLVENLLVALLAVPAALAVAWTGFRLIKSAMPATLVRFLPGWNEMGIDGRLMLVTLAGALAAAVGSGLLPALRASRPGLADTLREGGRSSTAGRGRNRLRRSLVVAQIAVALPLLILSGLSVVGIQRFANGPQGYNPDGVIRLRMRLPSGTYPDTASRRQFVDRLLDAAGRVPGADVVAASSMVPASPTNQSSEVVVEGVPLDPTAPLPMANYRGVSPDYLRAMEIPIEQGRAFTAGDREDTQRVVIVSQSMAQRHWPDTSPIGARLTFDADRATWFTVVGVAGDTIDDWFANRRAPTVYVPVTQARSGPLFLVARTSGDPALLADGLRDAIATVDPTIAPFDIATGRAAIHQRTTGLRFVAGLMLTFGLLALALAALGIYGVMAHYVAQRRHDIGVRMALGATGGRVLRQTLGEGARLSALGILLGLGIGIGLARVLENALFGIAALEPGLVAAVTAALSIVAITATLVPAHHATRVDPVTALRAE